MGCCRKRLGKDAPFPNTGTESRCAGRHHAGGQAPGLAGNDVPKRTRETTIRVARGDLDSAAAQHLISSEELEPLWRELVRRDAERPRFNLPNLIYYFGAMVIIVGMTLLVPKAWEKFGGAGLSVIALSYG